MLSQAWKMVGRSLKKFQFVGCAVLICLVKIVGAVEISSGVVGVLP